MGSKHLIRIAVMAAGLAAVMSFAGLQLADASSQTTAARATSKVWCGKYDADDTTEACFGLGPRGARGARGKHGRRGNTGATGKEGGVGGTGPVGKVGRTGLKGAQGIQGIQGIQGANGAFVGNSNHALIEYATAVGPIPFPGTPGTPPEDTGTELPAAVARCPISGPDTEAYDGGANVTVTTSGGAPAAGDVVELQSAYPGNYNGQGTVDPLPFGSTPGAVSPQPANAYEVQAVVAWINTAGDKVTIQPYVLCGP